VKRGERLVWLEPDGDDLVVHVATGPRPWAFRLGPAAFADLEAEIAELRRAQAADEAQQPARGRR
jgi:hypothetical protein